MGGSNTLRDVSYTDQATITLNWDTTDIALIDSLSQNTTFAQMSGSPTVGRKMEIRIISSSARTLSWHSSFKSSDDISLPTTTSGGGKLDRIWVEHYPSGNKNHIVGRAFGTTL